jgi:hypothetical protein
VGAALVAGLLGLGPGACPVLAEQGASETSRHLAPPRRGAADRPAPDSAAGSSGWWLGTAGLALALAVCGGISLVFRRHLPPTSAGPLRVIGRTSLSPKHTLYLLQAGERVLIVGAGSQGPPALLGELTDLDAGTATKIP